MGSIPTVSTTWISRNLPLDSFTKKYGGVAQLVRVFGSHPKGRGFESLRLHHFCTVRFDGLFFSAHFVSPSRLWCGGVFVKRFFAAPDGGRRGKQRSLKTGGGHRFAVVQWGRGSSTP